jgi:hypothetical protein
MNLFNGRLDSTLFFPVAGDPTKWDMQATLFDASGIYDASYVQLDDRIYNDCSLIGMGAVRLKVVYLDSNNQGQSIRVRVQWDMLDAQPSEWTPNDYPIAGTPTIIGHADTLGVTVVSSIFGNLVDEVFIAAVRNVESAWVSAGLALKAANKAEKTGDAANKFKVADAVASDEAVPLAQADTRYARFNGNPAQIFSVAPATQDTHALSRASAGQLFALKNGNPTQIFKVAAPVEVDDALSLGAADARYLKKTDVLDGGSY